MISGKWQNVISKKEYLFHHKQLNSYGHPTSTESVKKFNREANTHSEDVVDDVEEEILNKQRN